MRIFPKHYKFGSQHWAVNGSAKIDNFFGPVFYRGRPYPLAVFPREIGIRPFVLLPRWGTVAAPSRHRRGTVGHPIGIP